MMVFFLLWGKTHALNVLMSIGNTDFALAFSILLKFHPLFKKLLIAVEEQIVWFIFAISALAEVASSQVALNIEGDIRDDIMRMVLQYNTTQFTVVPVSGNQV